jgi:hypothetical protein
MTSLPYPDHFERDGWVIDHNRSWTKRAYDLARGKRRQCNCAYCRNYRVVREDARPRVLTEILFTFGIDPDMEAEVSEHGPATSGNRVYSGWYSFAGQVRRDAGDRMLVLPPDAPGTVQWQVFFTPGRSLAFDTFGDEPLVQLEFQVELPWVPGEV